MLSKFPSMKLRQKSRLPAETMRTKERDIGVPLRV
jgi:hypothetical protein